MTWKEWSVIILCILFSFILGRASISPVERINNRMDEIEQRVSDSIENHQLVLARFDRFLANLGLGGLGVMEEITIYPDACLPDEDCTQARYGWMYKFDIPRIKEILETPEKFSDCGYLKTSNQSMDVGQKNSR